MVQGFVEAMFDLRVSEVVSKLRASGDHDVFCRLKHENAAGGPAMEMLWATTVEESRRQCAKLTARGVTVFGIGVGERGYAARVAKGEYTAAVQAVATAECPRRFRVVNVPAFVSEEELRAGLESVGWGVTVVHNPDRAWLVISANPPPSWSLPLWDVVLGVEEITGRRSLLPPLPPAPAMHTSYAAAAGGSAAPVAVGRHKKRQHAAPSTTSSTQAPPAVTPSLAEWMQEQETRQAAWQEKMAAQQAQFQATMMESLEAMRLAVSGKSANTPNEDTSMGEAAADASAPASADVSAVLQSEVSTLRADNERLMQQLTALQQQMAEMSAALRQATAGSRQRDHRDQRDRDVVEQAKPKNGSA